MNICATILNYWHNYWNLGYIYCILVYFSYVFSATEILLNLISNTLHGVPTSPTRMVIMQVSICQICKEPIWTFICSECLARDIKNWLPKKLSIGFSKFNRNFIRHFHYKFFSSSQLPCLHCKQIKQAPVCAFCYIREVFVWLKDKNMDLANTLLKLTSIADISEDFQPVTEFKRENLEEGICEYCGMFSHELVFQSGKWICKECGELEY